MTPKALDWTHPNPTQPNPTPPPVSSPPLFFLPPPLFRYLSCDAVRSHARAYLSCPPQPPTTTGWLLANPGTSNRHIISSQDYGKGFMSSTHIHVPPLSLEEPAHTHTHTSHSTSHLLLLRATTTTTTTYSVPEIGAPPPPLPNPVGANSHRDTARTETLPLLSAASPLRIDLGGKRSRARKPQAGRTVPHTSHILVHTCASRSRHQSAIAILSWTDGRTDVGKINKTSAVRACAHTHSFLASPSYPCIGVTAAVSLRGRSNLSMLIPIIIVITIS